MSQSDGAAVDIDLVHVETQLLYAGQGLGSECFVQLDQIDVVQSHVVLRQQFADCTHRADAHDQRITAFHLKITDGCPDLFAFTDRAFFFHHDHGAGTVAHRRAGARGDAAVL